MEHKDERLLSVIVAIYNVEPYLDRCLRSIVSQTYSNLEIILVDDGSPDNCPAKCDEWAAHDDRIKVIHKENAGAGFARNSGLEIATGDYVAFVDPDDWLDKDMYSLLMKEATVNDVDCVYCGFRQQLPSLRFVDVLEMDKKVYRGAAVAGLARRFIMDFSQKHLHFGVWHGVYRRELIDFKFVSERVCMSEDLVFTYMFMCRCRSFSYVPSVLYNYMFNAKSLSRNYNEQTFSKILATARVINEFYDGTQYNNVGNAYAFCQVYFLMRFSIMKARIPLQQKYKIFKKIIQDEEYNNLLQDRSLFEFQAGMKYKLIKGVYFLQRKKRVLLNFLAVLLISLKKG